MTVSPQTQNKHIKPGLRTESGFKGFLKPAILKNNNNNGTMWK